MTTFSAINPKALQLNKAPIVYLAGGMRGDWQDLLMKLFPGVMFIDPRKHGCGDDEAKYTAWDLTGVSICDIVFGYLESSNPAGQGLCVEFGVARASNKYILYVEEPRQNARYFGMTRAISNITTPDFYYGVFVLSDLLGRKRLNRESCTKEFFEKNPEFVFEPL